MAADVPLDAWGLPIVPPDPPVADVELGYTCTEDADDWGPAQVRVPPPVTRAAFVYAFATASYGIVRWVVCRTGVHRRRRPR